MSKYQIHRWDVVMFGNSNSKIPMIYVKPDITFLDFIRKNDYAVVCEIEGTGTIYDGKQIPGIVDKSSYVPNCRPNFFEQTGYYVVTLWSNWYGYPNVDMNGEVKFLGLKEPDNSTPLPAPEKPQEKIYPKINPTKSSFKIPQTYLITAIVLSSALILFMIYRLLKN
jgi:hypothetical protein